MYTIQAPAKVNLALAVGPAGLVDDDPRHLICSWMVAVDLCDDLALTPLDDGFFSRYAILWAKEARQPTEITWSITRDLAVRAHLLLEAELGRKLPVQLKLEKRIPVGAGLGGGSSDAAAMLLGCNALFKLGLSRHELRELAARLGSDVAFFIDASDAAATGGAVAEGFGERLSRVAKADPLALVLVLPEIVCPTPEVYRAYDALHSRDALAARFSDDSGRVRSLAERFTQSGAMLREADLFNDLAPAAFARFPDLIDLARRLERLADRRVHVSGSGSTLFVVCDDQMHADFLARACEAETGVPALAVGAWEGQRPEASEVR